MTIKIGKTGQLLKSDISNCPVFIPAKLSDSLVSELCVNTNSFSFEEECPFNFLNVFNLYFQKFFAGNMSLIDGFSDLPIVNLYLWSEVKMSKDVYVKQVINDIKKFNKVLAEIKSDDLINKHNLAKYNKLLQTKKCEYGFRKGEMRVGNPSKVDYAFHAPPVDMIDGLLENVFEFVKSANTSKVNLALITMFQLFFIHPFKDGNGRVVRALMISFLEKELGLIPSYLLMLYFKVINPENYYLAQKSYREGIIKELKKFNTQAIEWTNQSTKILSDLIKDYGNKVGENNIETNNEYSQIVIKIDAKAEINESHFQFHSKKAGKNIYINTALLNVLNQFDYYLRYELRKHQLVK